jgi:hypothetical protein
MPRTSMPGFFSRAWGNSSRARKRTHSPRKQYQFRKLLLEVLEDRTVPSTVTVGELVLSGAFENNVATGQVLIGFDETNPLIAVNDGQVMADPGDGTFTVMPSGEGVTVSISVFTLSANPTIWMSSSQDPVVFDADDLVSGGHSFADDGGEAEGITVAGLSDAFFTTNLALAEGENGGDDLVNLQGHLDFGSIGISGLTVAVDDTNDVAIDSGTKDVTLTGVEAQVEDDFTVAGVGIDGSLNVGYSSQGDTFSFGGGVTVMATGLEGSSSGSTLGATLDMTIEDGDIEAIDLAVSGSFNVWVLEIAPDNLTFEYSTADEQFVMFGDITVKVPNGQASDGGASTTSITGQFGDSDDPGLIIDASGTVSQVNIDVFGTLNVLGFTFESPQSNPATFQYMADQDLYELSGTISAPKFWNATVTMGTQEQPGIKIENGNWSVDALDVSLSNVKLGAFEIRNFEVDFTQPSSTELDFDFTLDVAFPQGWAVDANIKTAFNESTKAFEINDVFLKASGLQIAIGETGLFLTEIDASLQNIFQPSNLIVSGNITVEYGEEVTIFGKTARFFLAQGGFTVDKDMLELDAQVWIGSVTSGGNTSDLLGTGTGTLTLDWVDQDYSLDVQASLLGGVFEFDGEFAFNAGTSTQPAELLIQAKADVNVPKGIALIGGKELGEIDFLLKYEAPSSAGGQAEGFVAAWTRISLVFTHVEVGIEYDFEDDHVKLLGSGGVHSLQKQASVPQSKTYVYSQPFTNSDGATQATLTVDWTRTFSSPPTSATVSVILPDGTTTVNQSNFSGSNGLSLITNSSGDNTVSSTTQTNVGIVNPAASTQTHTGSVTDGETSITILGSTVDASINGWAVSGTGIPDGTTVIYVNGTTLKLSQPATSSASSATLTFTDPYLTLPFSPGQTSTNYTLQVSLTSEQAPINSQVSIATITKDSATGNALVTFSGAVPSNIQVGDTISISGSSNSGYNSSDTYSVTEITSNGVVINQPYTSNASGGTMSGWTLPQFSATYHLPPPTILVGQIPDRVTTSQLSVNMPVQVVSGLESNTTVDLYIDTFNASAGADQDFNGILLAKNVPLTSISTTNGQVSYQAQTTIDLSQPQLGLLPIDYYLYAVVNDGTNTPVTSTLTSEGSGGFLETFTNSPVVDGFVTNQKDQDQSGWTVFVDTNGNGVLDSGEPSTMTNSEGFYGFYDNQVTAGTIPVVVQLLDPSLFTFEQSSSLDNAGAAIVDEGNGLSVPVTWDGSTDDPVSLTLVANQLSSISGMVSDATTEEGLGGWLVFFDSNGNGQLDPGETSTQSAADGSYTFLNLNSATITSISASSDPSSPTTVLNLAAAVPSVLQVGDTITVSGSSVSAYNTTHTITAINAQSVITDVPFTTAAVAGLLAGPDVTETVTLAIMNGSAATYTFDTNQVQGDLVLDSSGGPNTQQHVGTLEGDASADTASDFGIEDHANAVQNNQILNIGSGGVVNIPSTTDLEPGTGAFSVAGWVRTDGVSPAVQSIAGAFQSGTEEGGWDFQLSLASFTFSDASSHRIGGFPYSVVVADFNGDAKLDLAATNGLANTVSVLRNTTSGGASTPSFAPQQTFAVGVEPFSIAVGDIDGDGKPDLAVANNQSGTVSVLRNTTAAGATFLSFAPQQTFAVGVEPVSIAVGDIDGDGKLDLAVANSKSANVSVLRNTTAAGASAFSFAAQQTFAAGVLPWSITVGDFNGDGKPDLAVANLYSNDVSVMRNTTATGASAFSFAAQQTFAVGNAPSSVAVGDFNDDGKPDLAVANLESSNNTVSVLRNTTAAGASAFSFAAQQTFAVGEAPIAVAVADFDGDGKSDLAAANSFLTTASVLRNTTAAGASAFSFAAQQAFDVGGLPQSVAVGDFDGDGRPDLASGISSNQVSVLRNVPTFLLGVEVVENTSTGSGSLTLQSPTGLEPDVWYHVAFTYDPNAANGVGMLQLFLNGAQSASSPNRGTLSTSPDISSPDGISVNIGNVGGDSGDQPFTGYLDDISFWDAALTATQIQALYNGTTSPSYTQTTPSDPATYTVTLSGAIDLEQGNDFTVTESSTVSGTVQANALSSSQLGSAMPVEGWTVNLLDGASQIVATTTTNANGDYVFAELDAGTYRLELLPPDGWRQTAAPNEGKPFTLSPGDLLDGLDFTAAQLGQINGGLYDDLNGDGQRDPGEPGRAGATVYLDFDENGQFDPGIDLASTTVDAGAYAFVGLADGTYHLRLAPIPGRLLTGPSGGLHEVTIAGGEATNGASLDFLTAVNAPPVVTGLATVPAFEGDPFRLEATFTDADSDTPHRDVTIAWGDGTSTTLTVTVTDGAGSIAAEHVYADGGFYDATLTIADAADATVSTTRRFTAIVSGAGIHDGVLQVVGTDASDRVLIVPMPGGRIRVNASFLPHGSKRFDAGALTALEFTLFAGDDTTTLNLRSKAASVLPAAIHLDSGASDSEGGDVLRLLARRQDIQLGDGEAVIDTTTITWTAGTRVLIVPTPIRGRRSTFGTAADAPAVGHFDGDGSRERGRGRLAIHPSSNPFAGPDNLPVQADHDGDEITDIAIHRFGLDVGGWRSVIPALVRSGHAYPIAPGDPAASIPLPRGPRTRRTSNGALSTGVAEPLILSDGSSAEGTPGAAGGNEGSRGRSIDLLDELFAHWPLVHRGVIRDRAGESTL